MPYTTTPELPDFDIEFEEEFMDEILGESTIQTDTDICWLN